MIRRKITTTGNSAALVLSQDLMGFMGVEVGDEVDLELIDRSLLVRPVREVDRATKVQGAIDRVFRKHGGLLSRLAEGPPGPTPGRTRRRPSKKR